MEGTSSVVAGPLYYVGPVLRSLAGDQRYLGFVSRDQAMKLPGCCLALYTLALTTPGQAAVIASCGFEPAGDTWSYTAVGGGVFNASLGPDDAPPNQRILSGSGSWLVGGGTTSILTFSDVLLSGWTDVAVAYRVSSTAATSTGGHSGGDFVAAYAAVDGAGFGDTADITLKGNSHSRWGYDSGAPQTSAMAGGSAIEVQPAAGSLRTTDGYSDFKIKVPSDKSSLAVKIVAKNGSVEPTGTSTTSCSTARPPSATTAGGTAAAAAFGTMPPPSAGLPKATGSMTLPGTA